MKTGKRITSLLLTLCLLVGMPLSVSATETDTDIFEVSHVIEMPDWMAVKGAVQNGTVDTNAKGRTLLVYFNSDPATPPPDYYRYFIRTSADGGLTAKGEWYAKYNDNYVFPGNNPIAITLMTKAEAQAARDASASSNQWGAADSIDDTRTIADCKGSGTYPMYLLFSDGASGKDSQTDLTLAGWENVDEIGMKVTKTPEGSEKPYLRNCGYATCTPAVEEALTLDRAYQIDGSTLYVKFSQEIDLSKLNTDDGFTMKLAITNLNNDHIESTSAWNSTTVSSLGDGWYKVSFASGIIDAAQDRLQEIHDGYTDANGNAVAGNTQRKLVFYLDDKDGEYANFIIESAVSTESGMSLIASQKNNQWVITDQITNGLRNDAALCSLTDATDNVTLTGAALRMDGIEMTFSGAVDLTAIDSSTVTAAVVKTDAQGVTTTWPIDLSTLSGSTTLTATYAEHTNDKTAYQAMSALQEGEQIELRITSNTADEDVTVDGFDRLLASIPSDAAGDAATIVPVITDRAIIGETAYDTLADALDKAVSGDVVTLLADAEMDDVILSAGVTLDLNGHSVMADNFVGFGYVIDSTEEDGALIISRDESLACIHLQSNNPSFPLYDTEIGGYRFFTYSLSNAGTKANTEGNAVTYGIKLSFESLRAYELLADEDNADVSLIMDLAIANRGFDYKFSHKIFNVLYEKVRTGNNFAKRGNYAITLTLSGLSSLGEDDEIVANPIFRSAQKVNSIGKSFTYEGVYDSYTRAKAWITAQIENNTLFSFDYGDAPYADHIINWNKKVEQTEDGWTVTYTNDDVVAWSEITLDPETASVEWTNYFKNNGTSASLIISNIRAMDSTVTVEDPVLTSANGSAAEATDFQPFSVDLTTQTTHTMATTNGRSSEGAFPYFDISNGEYGIMGGIGWTGNWNANFVNDNGNVTIDTGMQETKISLYAGEQMRTPMMMIQFFKGDRDDGHNAFRQLIFKSYTPADASGQPIDHAMLSVGVGNLAGQGETAILDKLKEIDAAGAKYENLWIDAGWYGTTAGDNLSSDEWIRQVGNWYFIPDVYSDNDADGQADIQNLSQYLKERGRGLSLWFEPERVYIGSSIGESQLSESYPGYLLDSGEKNDLGLPHSSQLWNFADDAACAVMIELVDGIIKENGVTWYRQDQNDLGPGVYWANNEEAEDRIGMMEIKYITNLYRYMDTLVEQNPGLMIDSCASGGRRLDLEMMKRSVPLWNSDYGTKDTSTPDGIRSINYNLSWWLPIHAGSWPNYNAEKINYAFRADMNSGMQINVGNITTTTVHTLIDQYFECRELMNGDYYILAAGKDDEIDTKEACYEFYKEEEGKGYLVAFRPARCASASATYCLKGLDANADYQVECVDTGYTWSGTGQELMETGLTLTYVATDGAQEARLLYITKQ